MHDNLDRRVLELLTSHGTLVPPDAIEYILSQNNPEEYIKEILKQFQEIPLFMNIDQLRLAEADMSGISDFEVHAKDENVAEHVQLSQLEQESQENPLFSNIEGVHHDEITSEVPLKIKSSLPSKKPLASEYDGDIKILQDVTGQSTSEGTLNDFIKYFQVRFETLRKILNSQRREVRGALEISKIQSQTGPIKFIGLVSNCRTTKQGHKIIELEDETDSISALINNSSPLINMNFINDEVVCVIGKLGKSDLVYVDDIIRPDIPIARKQNRSELPFNCIFMADVHIGSNKFLHGAWDKFIKWLNGAYSINGTDEFIDRLKYIVVSGDVVDGIGIYPNQESELEILDIYAQYEDIALKFQALPEHIQLIVQPGNHDAVRPAEPQPTFPSEITQLFSNDIKFVGNPCYFTLNNVEILSYHGRSMDDFVMQLPNVTYSKPIQIMKEMLVRRHLAPVYGQKTPIAPEHRDYLLIEKLPDIFVTGHIHKTACEQYRDITLINASAWQAQTNYQKMMNFNPDPGKILVADLQSRKVNIVNFA